MHSWLPYLWYDSASLLVRMGMTIGFSLRTEGRSNVPKTGPVLVIANHQSFFDPVLVGTSVRRHLVSLARLTLFRHRWLAWLMGSFKAIPIDHHRLGKEGLKSVLAELERGQAVLVFPEGTRSRDGRLQPLKAGIHLLLQRSRAPVVPVGVAGAFDAWPPWRPMPLPEPIFLPARGRSIGVSVGTPLEGGRFADLPREQALTELQQELAKAVTRAEHLRRKP